MRKLISVHVRVVKILDEIRKEKNCSYAEAIEMICAEKGKEDRVLTRIRDDFESYKEIMANIEHELEIMRIILVWLYKAPSKTRKEAARGVRENLEEILSAIITEVRKNGKKQEKKDI